MLNIGSNLKSGFALCDHIHTLSSLLRLRTGSNTAVGMQILFRTGCQFMEVDNTTIFIGQNLS